MGYTEKRIKMFGVFDKPGFFAIPLVVTTLMLNYCNTNYCYYY